MIVEKSSETCDGKDYIWNSSTCAYGIKRYLRRYDTVKNLSMKFL